MNKRKVFSLIAAVIMWICVGMDVFTSIHSFNDGRYCLTVMAVIAGFICASCGVYYTKVFLEED